jgi:hypothetical protein
MMALTFTKRRPRRSPILKLLALSIVVLILLLGSNAFAGKARTLSSENMQGKYTARTICVDGYKFILANKNTSGGGVSLIRFYEERNGKALPAKC